MFNEYEEQNIIRLTSREIQVLDTDSSKVLIRQDQISGVFVNMNRYFKQVKREGNKKWWNLLSIQLNSDTFAIATDEGLVIIEVNFE
ncbi:hypothetical protein FGO68_gene8785 [Halteria grandinella]|uniref:Uncharacterized protein n=1 Tax=Halteria grandinella TaxID=5974 RepID=A0A8J8T8H1_HALGN|nr:hypothetical protein FGO68_gene8785 [Halteria grandinella]